MTVTLSAKGARFVASTLNANADILDQINTVEETNDESNDES